MKTNVLLATLMVWTVFSCTNPSPEQQATNDLTRSLDSLVQLEVKNKFIPSVAVGIVKDGEVVLAKAYGYADVEEKTAANAKTIYQLGSVTKLFTGHVLAHLIEQGDMALTDRLATFFPELDSFPIPPDGTPITVRDIATHSAEFPRYPENLDRQDPHPIKGYTRAAMMTGIQQVEIDTATGYRYNYSNFGYGVLGLAMEFRTDTTYEALVQQHILEPYGMTSSSVTQADTQHSRLAVPYLAVNPEQRTEPWDMGTLSAAGNIFSNVDDLNQFMLHLLTDKAVNRTQQQKLLRINDTWSYGLGCFVIDSETYKTPVIYHGGDIDGYASSLTLYPEHRLGIVLLTNYGAGETVGDTFIKANRLVSNHYLQ